MRSEKDGIGLLAKLELKMDKLQNASYKLRRSRDSDKTTCLTIRK